MLIAVSVLEENTELVAMLEHNAERQALAKHRLSKGKWRAEDM